MPAETGLDGELAAEAAALGAARKRELEAGGHQRAVLDRLPEEELGLDREVAESGRGGPVAGVHDHHRDLHLDVPARQEWQLDGGRHLRLTPVPALLVLDSQLQLALGEGTPSNDSAEELDVGLLLGHRGSGREEERRGDQRAEPAHEHEGPPLPEQVRRSWLARRARKARRGWLVEATSSGSACPP